MGVRDEASRGSEREVLRQGAPSFRYAVGLALKPPPEGKTPAEWLERLTAAAGAVLKARESSLEHAIVGGEYYPDS